MHLRVHPPNKLVSNQILTNLLPNQSQCKQNCGNRNSSGESLIAQPLCLLSVKWGSCTPASPMRTVGMKEPQDAKVY